MTVDGYIAISFVLEVWESGRNTAISTKKTIETEHN